MLQEHLAVMEVMAAMEHCLLLLDLQLHTLVAEAEEVLLVDLEALAVAVMAL
jgi:hypothetical protein